MKCNCFFDHSIRLLIGAVCIFCPLKGLADSTWSYHKDTDRLSNLSYSVAQSPLPLRGLYDSIKLDILCKENKLQAVINADSLITSQGSPFTIEYQIDKRPPVTLVMKTFPDSKRKGYADKDVQRMAEDMLTGQAIFIRINTLIKKVLSTSISLENAAKPITRILNDCGVDVTAPANETSHSDYSLVEFEQDFGRLSKEQQQQVLGKIKQILKEIR
jgi:uncharacterized protein YoaH (UPF0181 family)